MKEIFEEIRARINCIEVLKRYGHEYAKHNIKCPFHDDKTPSFSVTADGNHFECFGCQKKGDSIELYELLSGKSKADSISDMKQMAGIEVKLKMDIVATYDYRLPDGTRNYQVVRMLPKDFRQRKSEYDWTIKGCPKTPFRIEKWYDKDVPVFIVEGEKDVCNCETLGFTATCNSGGAGKWTQEHAEYLKDKICYILPDNDEPGMKHGQQVAKSLNGKAKEIRIVNLPGLPAKGDVSDFIQQCRDNGKADAEIKAEIETLVNAAPVFELDEYVEPEPKITGFTETDKIKARFFEILNDAKIRDKASAMAETVLEFLLERGKLYYHAKLKTFDSSMFFDMKRHVLLKICSDEFKSWLADYTYINRADSRFKYIFSGIETASLDDKYSQGIIPSRFWIVKDSMVYLSNGDGQLVRISTGKYEMCDNGTDGILFEAGYTLKPWTIAGPKNPFECSLFKNASYADPDGYMLLQLYGLSLPTNPRCKPPLVLTSPVGGGKTRTAVGLCEIYGIPARISKVFKEGEADFWTGVNDGGVLILDNADTKTDWLADALATASTGGQHTKRKLYSDSTVVSLDANSWTIVTSANPTFGSDAGLADRTMLIRLKRREGETADSLLSDEISLSRDAGLSFACDIISKALADTSPTPKALNKRHPDFAEFAVKLGRAMGREKEAIQALQSAELDKSRFNLENDDLGMVILAYMTDHDEIEGTTAEILRQLKDHDPEFNPSSEKCPKGYWNPKKAGMRLAKLEPHLSELFNFKKTHDRNNVKTSISRRVAVSAVTSKAVSPKVLIFDSHEDFCQNSQKDTADTAKISKNSTSDMQEYADSAIYEENEYIDVLCGKCDFYPNKCKLHGPGGYDDELPHKCICHPRGRRDDRKTIGMLRRKDKSCHVCGFSIFHCDCKKTKNITSF